MFGRRRAEPAAAGLPDPDPLVSAEAPEDADVSPDPQRTDNDHTSQGPWDFATDQPPAAPEGWGRIDLGSLVLTVPPDVEVRMDVDQQTQAVNTVGVVIAPLMLQVMPYAGPRTMGIWDDVRAEIAANLATSGGTAVESEGIFGSELKAKVPSEKGVVEARFFGVDGPRWFLRGVISGTGAHDDQACDKALEIYSRVIVVRDDEARPSQEPLPIRLPQQANAAPAPEDADPDSGDDALNPFERGPEITEIR